MVDSKWQISDKLWEKMTPLIPEHKTRHPLGTHRKRVDNRAAMNAIFFVLRTLPVECAECDTYLLIKLSSSPFPGMV
jgi:hypothetical protein